MNLRLQSSKTRLSVILMSCMVVRVRHCVRSRNELMNQSQCLLLSCVLFGFIFFAKSASDSGNRATNACHKPEPDRSTVGPVACAHLPRCCFRGGGGWTQVRGLFALDHYAFSVPGLRLWLRRHLKTNLEFQSVSLWTN